MTNICRYDVQKKAEALLERAYHCDFCEEGDFFISQRGTLVESRNRAQIYSQEEFETVLAFAEASK